MKEYTLIDSKGNEYKSLQKGLLGGHKKLKIYGKLDCPSALRHIKNGNYVKHRVFFADEKTAVLAGYRPCAICLPEEYQSWKSESNISNTNL